MHLLKTVSRFGGFNLIILFSAWVDQSSTKSVFFLTKYAMMKIGRYLITTGVHDCLQTLTSFSLTCAKLLVRVVGRSSFDLVKSGHLYVPGLFPPSVKSFTHGRICNAIFGRCRYSDFFYNLTVKYCPDILTFLQFSGWNLAYMWSDSRLNWVREFSFISFVLIAFCQP